MIPWLCQCKVCQNNKKIVECVSHTGVTGKRKIPTYFLMDRRSQQLFSRKKLPKTQIKIVLSQIQTEIRTIFPQITSKENLINLGLIHCSTAAWLILSKLYGTTWPQKRQEDGWKKPEDSQ